MPGPQTALGYIAQQLKDPTDLGRFTKEWSRCGEADKATLKKWAVEEMDALGISHT